jgi:hypothetical protein
MYAVAYFVHQLARQKAFLGLVEPRQQPQRLRLRA